jgi:hypothetical protein
MTRTLIATAMLAVAVSTTTVALAGPKSPGASVRSHVSIRPARPGPAVRPRIRVPSLGDHVARRVLKKHRARTRTRWTGSWHTEFVSPRGRAARNRRNFLSLLQVPLRPAAPAAGAPAARPSFGAGLRSGIFEPNSADAHDRYANMEASYLLSRMPSSSGGGFNEIRLDDRREGE